MKSHHRRLALPLLLVGLLLGGACGGERKTGGGATESTAALGLRVRLELLQKLGVDGLRVTVDTDHGRVRLSGEVHKRSTAELAEKVAGSVEGVSSVRNDIRVSGEAAPSGKLDAALAEAQHELDDAALATRVRLALVDHFGSDGFRIGTAAADGVVTLEFPSTIDRARRRDIVRWTESIAGVSRVVALDRE